MLKPDEWATAVFPREGYAAPSMHGSLQGHVSLLVSGSSKYSSWSFTLEEMFSLATDYRTPKNLIDVLAPVFEEFFPYLREHMILSKTFKILVILCSPKWINTVSSMSWTSVIFCKCSDGLSPFRLYCDREQKN